MARYLSRIGVLLKNFGDHVQAVTQCLLDLFTAVIEQQDRPIQYFPSPSVRKTNDSAGNRQFSFSGRTVILMSPLPVDVVDGRREVGCELLTFDVGLSIFGCDLLSSTGTILTLLLGCHSDHFPFSKIGFVPCILTWFFLSHTQG